MHGCTRVRQACDWHAGWAARATPQNRLLLLCCICCRLCHAVTAAGCGSGGRAAPPGAISHSAASIKLASLERARISSAAQSARICACCRCCSGGTRPFSTSVCSSSCFFCSLQRCASSLLYLFEGVRHAGPCLQECRCTCQRGNKFCRRRAAGGHLRRTLEYMRRHRLTMPRRGRRRRLERG